MVVADQLIGSFGGLYNVHDEGKDSLTEKD